MMSLPKIAFIEYLIKNVRLDNQVRWESMKRIIKDSQHENFDEYRRLTDEQRVKYLTLVKYFAEDDEISSRIQRIPPEQSLLFE